jgi:hypothetical protein
MIVLDFDLNSLNELFESVVFFMGIIIAIIIVQKFIQLLIARAIRRTDKLSPDIINGLRVLVRLGAAVVIFLFICDIL